MSANAQTFDYKTSGTDFILYNVSIPQENESVAFAGGSQYTVESAPGVVIKTTDGGETWENNLYTGYHHFYGLNYKGNKILAAGTDEDVYLSDDNGENFEMIFNGPGDNQLYDISFFADNSGLICGSGGVMIKFSGVVLSTNENIQSRSVIYPNPAKDVLNVKNNSAIDQIVISDMTGKTVYSQKNLNSEVQIDLNGLSKGVYIIRINSGGSINTHKFSKK